MPSIFLTQIVPADTFDFKFDHPADMISDKAFVSLVAAQDSFKEFLGYEKVKWAKKDNLWEGVGLDTGFRILDTGERVPVKHILLIKEIPLLGKKG